MATVTEQVIVIGAGQSGLAAADALIRRGIRPMVLEAGAEPTGSWSHYYDGLRLFTPARLNALRGVAFPGDPTRYPTRDQVTDYLRSYAARLDCDIRTDARVDAVTRLRDRYEIRTADGAVLNARSVIAATGQFDKPHHPRLPSLYPYTGTVRHVASYRNTEGYHGLRVIVVGSGNSAVQIAVELSAHARVSIASRAPIRYAGTEPVPGNSHFWTALSHAGRLPIGRLFGSGTIPVIDTMGYRKAIEAGRPDHRPLPIWAEGTTVHWPDGSAETVDVVLLATGYRPALDYLGPLVLLGSRQGPGIPNHRSGLARDHPGLAFVGIDNQRTILSSTLHGVTRDATHVADALATRLSHSRQSRRKRSRRRS